MRWAFVLLIPCALFALSDAHTASGQSADLSSTLGAVQQLLNGGSSGTFGTQSGTSSQKGFSASSYGPGATSFASGNLKSGFSPSSYSKLASTRKSSGAELIATGEAVDLLSQAGISADAAEGLISAGLQTELDSGPKPSNYMATNKVAKGQQQGFAASRYGLGLQVANVGLAQSMGSFGSQPGQFFPELNYGGTSGVLDSTGTYADASLLGSPMLSTDPLEAISQNILLDAVTQSNPYSPIAQTNPFATDTSATTSLITNTQSKTSTTSSQTNPLTSSSWFGSTSSSSQSSTVKLPQKRTWP